MKKSYSKKELLKKLKELGVLNVELTYSKSEGWWLTCNGFDDWIAMGSFGAMLAINRTFKKYNEFIKWKNTKNSLKGELFTGGQYDFANHMLEVIEKDEKLKKMMLGVGNKSYVFEQIAWFYKDDQRNKN